MIHIYYITAIISSSCLTFYLTKRHYHRPSSPLPAQTSSEPISVPNNPESSAETETPQDSINNLVEALDQNTKSKQKDKSTPKSWLGMN